MKNINSPVEVERGEPATKIDDELVVYGNLKIPNQYVELFGNDKAKGKKFKNYIKEISKDEEKQKYKSVQAVGDVNLTVRALADFIKEAEVINNTQQ